MVAYDETAAKGGPGPGPITPPPKVETETGSWLVPGVLAGVGLVGVGVGVGLGLASSSAKDDVISAAKLGVCADPASAPCLAARDRESSANGLGAGSVVGYVAGGAFLVGGVVTALVMKPWQERRKGARVEAAPTLGGIVVRGTF